MKARLAAVRAERSDVVTFHFEPQEPLAWEPGQFLQYLLPHPEMDDRNDDRFFTISAAPFEGHLRVTTRLSPRPSSFKKALVKLQVGAELEIGEPEGEFVVTDPHCNHIFVAAGTGITPFRSMLAEADHAGQQLSVRLLYGSRDDDIVFKDELDGFAARNQRLKIDYLVSPRRIDEDRLRQAIEAVIDPYVYLSGPEPMVEAFAVVVKKLGVDGDHIRTDFFTGYDAIYGLELLRT